MLREQPGEAPDRARDAAGGNKSPGLDGAVAVLLVEASDSASDLIRRTLLASDLPCRITRCATAEQASAALREPAAAFDLALVDQDLPDLPGVDLCVRLGHEDAAVPCILLVAPGEEPLAAEALAAGVADCVVMDVRQGYAALLPPLCKRYGPAASDRPAQLVPSPAAATKNGGPAFLPPMRASEDVAERYRRLLEQTAAGITLTDAAGGYLAANARACEMLGYTEAELCELTVRDVMPDEAVAAAPAHVAARSNGDAVLNERRLRRKDGRCIHAEVRTITLQDGRVQSVLRDITAQQHAEQELETARALLQATLDSTADGILVVDANGKVVTYNRRFAEIWSLPDLLVAAGNDDQLLRFVVDQLVDPDAFLARIQALYADPEAESLDILEFKDGRVLERYSQPQQIGGRGGVRVWSFRDVTGRQHALTELQRTEERLHALLANAPVVLFAVDRDGIFTMVEGKGIAGLGAPATEVLGLCVYDVLGSESPMAANVRAALEGRELTDLVELGGFTFDVRYAPLRDDHGTITGVIGVAVDCTEQRRAERALRDSEQRYRLLADQARDVIWIVDATGRLSYISPVVERYLGYTPNELMAREHAGSNLSPASAAHAAEILRQAIEGEADEFRFDAELRTRAGQPVWGEISAWATRDETGALVSLQGVTRDITERKAAEEALRESEERYRLMAEAARDVIWSTDARGNFTYLSPSVERIFGYAPDELIGWHFLAGVLAAAPDFMAPGLLERVLAGDADLVIRDDWLMEVPQQTKAGDVVWCEVSAAAVRDEQGTLISIQGVTRDITERRRAEEALRESEERYRHLTGQVRDVIWVLDASGRFTYGSPSVEGLTGFSPKEIVGKSLDTIVHPDSMPHAMELFAQAVAGELDEALFEADLVHIDGTTRPCEISCVAVRDAEGRLVTVNGITRDISERKSAEAALRESEARYRLLADNARDLIWTMDAEGRCTYVSPSVERLVGFTPAELEGELYDERVVSPQVRDAARECGLKAYAGELDDFRLEGEHRSKGGGTLWCEVNTVVLRDDTGRVTGFMGVTRDISERKRAEEQLLFTQFAVDHAADAVYWILRDGRVLYANESACRALGYSREELCRMTVPDLDADAGTEDWPDIWRDLEERGAITLESRHRRKDGSLFPVEIQANLVTYQGRQYNCAFARDITHRRREERERRDFEAQMQHTQKLESLGVLAGGIAHDFNNLLVGILGNAGLALMDIPADSPTLEYLQRIETGAQRAADLTNQMLAYSGRGKFIIRRVDLSALVEEMTHLLDTVISKKAVLQFNLASDLSPIEGDATQIRQVIMNLITNASDAVGEASGAITIATGHLYADRTYLADSYLDEELPEGTYVYLEVSDTGAGMDAETLARIFDPFFSTKFTGRGLGLAAVLGIVRGHRGALKVISEPGLGTTFRVLLPAVEQAVEEVPAQPAAGGDEAAAHGTVLVVDDEESVRSVARATLERAGYAILTATNGAEALEVFRRHADEIVLVLLDMTMPQMNGTETFRELRDRHGDVRVLLSSGYTEQEGADQLQRDGLAGFIQKPYRPIALLEKVRAALRE